MNAGWLAGWHAVNFVRYGAMRPQTQNDRKNYYYLSLLLCSCMYSCSSGSYATHTTRLILRFRCNSIAVLPRCGEMCAMQRHTHTHTYTILVRYFNFGTKHYLIYGKVWSAQIIFAFSSILIEQKHSTHTRFACARLICVRARERARSSKKWTIQNWFFFSFAGGGWAAATHLFLPSFASPLFSCQLPGMPYTRSTFTS